MVERVETKLFDDIDGTEATHKVRFAFEGKAYRIDLSGENYVRMASAISEWIDHARRDTDAMPARGASATTSRPLPKQPSSSEPARPSVQSGTTRAEMAVNATIREWARAQGLMSDQARGRISQEIRDQFAAAHS